MSADWIKFEVTTPDKPEVVRMASILNIDQDSVTGKLLRVWIWCNANSVTGSDVPVTSAFIDRLTACPGFAVAMREVGWLFGRDAALEFPHFSRHNGQSAKARAEVARRVSKHRQTVGCNANTVTNVTPKPLQKPLPEKRREEKNILPSEGSPIVPKGTGEVLALAVEVESSPKPNNWTPSPFQTAVGSWFNRRETTPWSPRELAAWKALGNIPADDVATLGGYYNAKIPKATDYRRRDLLTLLNNWTGELDRARKFNPKPTDDRAF